MASHSQKVAICKGAIDKPRLLGEKRHRILSRWYRYYLPNQGGISFPPSIHPSNWGTQRLVIPGTVEVSVTFQDEITQVVPKGWIQAGSRDGLAI